MPLYFEIHFFLFFFTPFSSLRAKQAFSPHVCAEMYISETSRHVFHSEKGSLHAGKGNRRIEGMASQVCECATSERTRDVSMKLSFKAHLRGCFLPSRCDPLCFGRIQTHHDHTAIAHMPGGMHY